MSDQHVHEVGVPHCVLCWDNDGVKLCVLWDLRAVQESVLPRNPLSQVLLDEVVVVDFSFLGERDRKRFSWGVTLLKDVILISVANVCA